MKQFQHDDSLYPMRGFASGAAVFFGGLMTLVGYLTSNVFCVFDLFETGPGGLPAPSPFQLWFTSPEAMWCVYAGCSTVAIIGMLMIASQPWSQTCGVVYIMCPIVAVTYLIFTPLRGSRSSLLADIYRTLGAALTSAGGFSLWQSYGGATSPVHPMFASIFLQIGIVAVILGSLSLRRGPREDDSEVMPALAS